MLTCFFVGMPSRSVMCKMSVLRGPSRKPSTKCPFCFAKEKEYKDDHLHIGYVFFSNLLAITHPKCLVHARESHEAFFMPRSLTSPSLCLAKERQA